MRVLLLGAGVTGVTTAWSLLQAGHEVTVVDRQPGPGLETSFANGGQISVSHPEPWSSPAAPMIALRSLGRRDAPVRLRFGMNPERWRWLLEFLRECWPSRHSRNTDSIARLAVHSATCLQTLRAATGLAYDAKTRGILHLHYDAGAHRNARERGRILNRYGIDNRLCSPDECVDIEPALAGIHARLRGGMYAPNDESGDAYLFTRALSRLATEHGAHFFYDTLITSLAIDGTRVTGAHVRDAQGERIFDADAVVVCLGCASPALAAQAGERLPIHPLKGYSITAPIVVRERAPIVSLTDEGRRIVSSRLGERLRVAGTAEINGGNTQIDDARIALLRAWLEELFPGATDSSAVEAWAGLRPCTPSCVPIIGPGKLEGLWFNTGHGSLGWTLAAGSADLLSALIQGKPSPVTGFPLHRG
ncbi:MAG TPA: D-amino acid dehydrogenase [Azoarcus sp.]|nr:D-amino acid dehydrogenase [Azoarcus sp.]